jgi:hypothetical protein
MIAALLPLSRKYSPIVAPVYGASYWSGAESEEMDATMTE